MELYHADRLATSTQPALLSHWDLSLGSVNPCHWYAKPPRLATRLLYAQLLIT
jgi:hypothetical protein